ncbi:MAG: hypothetical protein WBD17_04325, partial [Candidatus Omnitrophota bacterium]
MNKRFFYYFAILMGVALALFFGFCEIPEIKAEEKPLVFAGHEELPPFSFYLNGAPAGFSVDLTRVLSVTIGREINIK